jgi:hypothetical protein
LWHQSRKRAFQCAIDALTTNHNHVLKVWRKKGVQTHKHSNVHWMICCFLCHTH